MEAPAPATSGQRRRHRRRRRHRVPKRSAFAWWWVPLAIAVGLAGYFMATTLLKNQSPPPMEPEWDGRLLAPRASAILRA